MPGDAERPELPRLRDLLPGEGGGGPPGCCVSLYVRYSPPMLLLAACSRMEVPAPDGLIVPLPRLTELPPISAAALPTIVSRCACACCSCCCASAESCCAVCPEGAPLGEAISLQNMGSLVVLSIAGRGTRAGLLSGAAIMRRLTPTVRKSTPRHAAAIAAWRGALRKLE